MQKKKCLELILNNNNINVEADCSACLLGLESSGLTGTPYINKGLSPHGIPTIYHAI